MDGYIDLILSPHQVNGTRFDSIRRNQDEEKDEEEGEKKNRINEKLDEKKKKLSENLIELGFYYDECLRPVLRRNNWSTESADESPSFKTWTVLLEEYPVFAVWKGALRREETRRISRVKKEKTRKKNLFTSLRKNHNLKWMTVAFVVKGKA